MFGTYIITFSTEEKKNGQLVEKETHILGVFEEYENAVEYLTKYYNHDVTNGDSHFKIIDERLHNTMSKRNFNRCYVEKEYEYDDSRFYEVMEIVTPYYLTKDDDPIKDISSIYGG